MKKRMIIAFACFILLCPSVALAGQLPERPNPEDGRVRVEMPDVPIAIGEGWVLGSVREAPATSPKTGEAWSILPLLAILGITAAIPKKKKGLKIQ